MYRLSVMVIQCNNAHFRTRYASRSTSSRIPNQHLSLWHPHPPLHFIATVTMPDTEKPTVAANKPRTRQRVYKPAPPIPVPDINEDAAERKRVLNVLAQRRYRALHTTLPMRCRSNHPRSTKATITFRNIGQPKRKSKALHTASSGYPTANPRHDRGGA